MCEWNCQDGAEWQPEVDAEKQGKWVDSLVNNFLDWYKSGEAGTASSATFETPPMRPNYLAADDETTPAPVAQPCKKRLLAADLRMTKQLEQMGMSKEEIRRLREENEAKRIEKDAEKARKAIEKAQKKQQKQQEATDPAEPAKKKRAAPAGPMVEACNAFVKARKSEGVGYFDALKMWKESAERNEILSTLSAQEIKRRRY